MNASSISGTSTYAATDRASGITTLYQSTSSIAKDDPNVAMLANVSYTTQIARSAKEQEAFDYTVALTHRQQPMEQANTSLDTIERRLGAIQKSIASERPGLQKAGWDFTVADGQLKVTGNASASDKAWLENKLNNDVILRLAANAYVDAAVSYLETSDENPAYHGVNGFSGSPMSYDFKHVKSQFEDLPGFKDIFDTLHKRYNNPSNTGILDPGAYRGADSLEYLGSLLK
ncbi:MAG: hypothetical protein EOP36_01865 [Rubrivivax sp.]|nr:MAG: hypothetical protein EOP36_01865 [Rubrivivax sp.]